MFFRTGCGIRILAQEGLNAAMQGRTTLIIAHRLATVKKVSRIIVLNQGRILRNRLAGGFTQTERALCQACQPAIRHSIRQNA
jgi:ABC-type bacteriocin/lantibiotic exporter with double-glycine peptidase domain